MATIPLGNFGQQGAGVSPGVSVDPNAFGAGTARAMTQMGETISAVANKQEAEKRQERLRLAGAKASNAQLQYEQDIYGVTEGIQKDITEGKIDYTKAPEEFQKRATAIQAPQIPDLDPAGVEMYSKGIERTKFKYGRTVDGLVEVKRKDDAKAQFGTGLESLDNMGGIPGSDPTDIKVKAEAFGVYAKRQGLDAAEVDKRVNATIEGAWLNHAKNRYIGSMSDPEKLQALQKDLTDGLYADKFDNSQRTALVGSIVGRIDQINEKQQRAIDRREATAGTAMARLEALISTGLPISPQAADETARSVSGTSMEKQFLSTMGDYAQVQKVMGLGPVEQQAYLQKMSADLQGGGVKSMAQVSNFNRLRAAIESSDKMRREDPLAFDAARTGTAHQPLDLANPDNPKNAAAFADRVSTLYAMRKQYGGSVPIKPLTDAEAQTLSAGIKKMPPQQQGAMLGLLTKQIRDPEAVKSAMGQMFGDDTLMLAAGNASARQLKTTGGTPLDAIILRGRTYLADKSVVLPKSKSTDGEALMPAFNELVGDAIPYGSKSRDAAYQTVRAVYVALAKDEGVLDGTFNSKLMERAVEIGLGGVSNYADKPTLRPYGTTDEAFQNGVRSQVRAIAKRMKLPESAMDDLPLENAGNDRYYLINGLEYVKGEDGRPVVIYGPNGGAMQSGAITAKVR